MFEHIPNIWDYAWVITAFFIVFLVLWIGFSIARRVKIKKSGGVVTGFVTWAPRLFMILTIVAFLGPTFITNPFGGTLTFKVFQETEDGFQLVDIQADPPSFFRFKDGTITDYQEILEKEQNYRFSFFNNTAEPLNIYEVYYFCDAYDFNNDCTSSPNKLKAEIPAYSYVGACCEPRNWSSQEEGPPSTVRLELGRENSIYWLTWGEANQY